MATRQARAIYRLAAIMGCMVESMVRAAPGHPVEYTLCRFRKTEFSPRRKRVTVVVIE
jgi:hypothetical protein